MISLIGIGPGAPGALTLEAEAAIREADLLIGAARMLAYLPAHAGGEAVAYRPSDIMQILARERPERPCVLYSGDPGFWSGAETLLSRLKDQEMEYRVLPGLSSVRLYVSGSNVLTFSKFKANDPESHGGAYGDFIKYPMTRVINFGVKLNM